MTKYRRPEVKDQKDLLPPGADALDQAEEFQVIVILEWDGHPPKMTFYDKMHRMGIWNRRRGTDKEEQSPLTRRMSFADDLGTFSALNIQEGTYLCRNIDVAKQIAALATQYGARVSVGGYLIQADIKMTRDDYLAWGDFTKSMDKRGRKRADEQGVYAVTCYTEGVTYSADLESAPFRCSQCGSYRIKFRLGKQRVVYYTRADIKGDLFGFWIRTRFDEAGNFEIPEMVKPGARPEAESPRQTPSTTIEPFSFVGTGDFFKKIIAEDELGMLDVYDAAYCLARLSETDRSNMRFQIVGQYGGEKYLLFASDSGYDPIDICIIRRQFVRFL